MAGAAVCGGVTRLVYLSGSAYEFGVPLATCGLYFRTAIMGRCEDRTDGGGPPHGGWATLVPTLNVRTNGKAMPKSKSLSEHSIKAARCGSEVERCDGVHEARSSSHALSSTLNCLRWVDPYTMEAVFASCSLSAAPGTFIA